MPKQYGIIPDVDVAGTNPVLRVIYDDDQRSPLRAKTHWNPSGDIQQIARSDFAVTEPEAHALKNDIDGTVTATQICKIQPKDAS